MNKADEPNVNLYKKSGNAGDVSNGGSGQYRLQHNLPEDYLIIFKP
jgi:hypothetical protein